MKYRVDYGKCCVEAIVVLMSAKRNLEERKKSFEHATMKFINLEGAEEIEGGGGGWGKSVHYADVLLA